MDIFIHTLSGAAVGAALGVSQKWTWKQKVSLFLLGAIGGALPDLDAISAWSGFDSTIGAWLGLDNRGSVIYSAKFWYSHHAFTHSLLWCGLIFAATFLLAKRTQSARFARFLGAAISLGSLAHILGDLPTPPGPWGGVAMFWPSKAYVGGWGKIWWWNNYDIFLLLLLLNIGLVGLSFFRSKWKGILAPLMTLAALAFMIRQINSRDQNFNGYRKGALYNDFESASKQYQRDLLGPTLYEHLEELDKRLPFHF